MPTVTKANAEQIYREAHAAALEASQAADPTPMIVGSPTTPFGSDIDPTKTVYYVADGLCGFAWVTITPARGPMVTYLKSIGTGYKGYYGGYRVSMRMGGQSYERKQQAASAFAKVLQGYGIECYVESRLD